MRGVGLQLDALPTNIFYTFITCRLAFPFHLRDPWDAECSDVAQLLNSELLEGNQYGDYIFWCHASQMRNLLAQPLPKFELFLVCLLRLVRRHGYPHGPKDGKKKRPKQLSQAAVNLDDELINAAGIK